MRISDWSSDVCSSDLDFGGLKAKVIEAVGKLEALSAAEVESLSDKSLTFTIGAALRLNFTGQDFLLSFSQPNFYFHVPPAYNLLSMNGLSIGKEDSIGADRRASRNENSASCCRGFRQMWVILILWTRA